MKVNFDSNQGQVVSVALIRMNVPAMFSQRIFTEIENQNNT